MEGKVDQAMLTIKEYIRREVGAFGRGREEHENFQMQSLP